MYVLVSLSAVPRDVLQTVFMNSSHTGRSGGMQVNALDSSQTIAVSQQLTAWAALVAGEGGWAWQRLSPGTPGRPSLPITGFIAGSTILVRCTNAFNIKNKFRVFRFVRQNEVL